MQELLPPDKLLPDLGRPPLSFALDGADIRELYMYNVKCLKTKCTVQQSIAKGGECNLGQCIASQCYIAVSHKCTAVNVGQTDRVSNLVHFRTLLSGVAHMSNARHDDDSDGGWVGVRQVNVHHNDF